MLLAQGAPPSVPTRKRHPATRPMNTATYVKRFISAQRRSIIDRTVTNTVFPHRCRYRALHPSRPQLRAATWSSTTSTLSTAGVKPRIQGTASTNMTIAAATTQTTRPRKSVQRSTTSTQARHQEVSRPLSRTADYRLHKCRITCCAATNTAAASYQDTTKD